MDTFIIVKGCSLILGVRLRADRASDASVALHARPVLKPRAKSPRLRQGYSLKQPKGLSAVTIVEHEVFEPGVHTSFLLASQLLTAGGRQTGYRSKVSCAPERSCPKCCHERVSTGLRFISSAFI